MQIHVVDVEESLEPQDACDAAIEHPALSEHFGVQTGLLRLLKSDMLTPFMAMQYLHRAKEPGVLAFLGTICFRFASS